MSRKSVSFARLIIFAAIAALLGAGAAIAQNDLNLAMTNPDKQAWELFLVVNAKAAGNNNALFETWARDLDTFSLNPTWPTTAPTFLAGPRALSLAVQQAHAGNRALVVPPDGDRLIGEETRRNRPDFDFIVNNNLFRVSGLAAAFKAGKTLSFPPESIEVKANWVAVDRLKEFNGFSGTPADAAKLYHVNSAAGKQYALVAFHIISKLVPNWTWATFEHEDNPGRCDVLGCRDGFGNGQAYVAPLSSTETSSTTSKTHYPPCVKTAALQALFAQANLDPAFSHYCLKGSQADFNDPTGVALRVGNSVTEQSFVAQASCMSCHGRAAFDSTGHATTFAGFDTLGPNDGGNAPVGPIRSSWYWQPAGPPYFPVVQNQDGLTRFALPADFVWSIPFCAIDDTAKPAKKTTSCDKK